MTTPETPAEHGIGDCPNCGYCLRGAVSLVCSECGVNVVASREAKRVKESRRDFVYSVLLWLALGVSWLHCKFTGGWSIVLDNDNVRTALSPVYLVLFNLPLQLFIALVASVCFFPGLPAFKPVGRILVLVNLILVLFGIGTTIVVHALGL